MDANHRLAVNSGAIYHQRLPGIKGVYLEGWFVTVLLPLLVRQGEAITCAGHIQPLGQLIITGSFVGIRHIAVERVDIRGNHIVGSTRSRVFPADILDSFAKSISLVETDDLVSAVFNDFMIDRVPDLLCFAQDFRFPAVITV